MKNYNQAEKRRKKKKEIHFSTVTLFFNILRKYKISEETINQKPDRKILEWKFSLEKIYKSLIICGIASKIIKLLFIWIFFQQSNLRHLNVFTAG